MKTRSAHASPQVSVVIPFYNAREYLAETLASLAAQNWDALEVIGVDDGSTDDSAELFLRCAPAARLLRQENKGPAHARNAAIHAATGEYIAFLDSDDLWPAGKLQMQLQRLQSFPELLATVGCMRLFRDELGDEGRSVRKWSAPSFLFLLGSMLAHRRIFDPDHVGVFDVDRFAFNGEDTDWFLRAWESGLPMEISEDTTLFYRRRPGSLSENADDTKRGFAALMMASLKRRRDVSGRVRPLPNTLRIPQQMTPRT
jgi:glycosyltransferase involved in cell wall biosynthesis